MKNIGIHKPVIGSQETWTAGNDFEPTASLVKAVLMLCSRPLAGETFFELADVEVDGAGTLTTAMFTTSSMPVPLNLVGGDTQVCVASARVG